MTWLKRGLPAVALFLVLTAPASAQVSGRPVEISAGAGMFTYDTRTRAKDGFTPTASLGWRLASWCTLEAAGVYNRSNSDSASGLRQSLLWAGADFRLDIRPADGHVIPYVLTGFGYGRSRASGAQPEKLVRGTPSLGAGVLFNLAGSSRLYGRLQVRDVMFKDRLSFEFSHELAVTAALHYVLAGKYKDSDLDGVRDWIDRCPDTPIGATVDARGCPNDADRDSVLDGLDKCPNTPAGCQVDKQGCPIDSDGDGVCDGLDKCPDTPKGCKVDANGCPIDTDGDGVCDGVDKCSGTPKGCKIDATGCPIDTDGDGVCDGLDECANTPQGAQVNEKGCETQASEREGDLLETGQIRLGKVAFETGTAAPTPESLATLDDVGQVLSKWPELKVEIGVHTDSRGKQALNLKLSGARADSIRAYLLQKYPAITPQQLVAKGYGATQPLASNATEAGRALNRRVEFVVVNRAALVKTGGARRLGAK